jgi:glycosyltransferase involved in cell wall biosynthesis
MYRQIRASNPDVIYLNSVFNTLFSIFPRVLIALRFVRPRFVLIAPRGEFDIGALAIRSRKKRSFLTLYRLLGLHRDVVWHASSTLEASAIRRIWGRQARIVVRENETSLPEDPLAPMSHEGPLRLVFLSRLSPKKGLVTVLRALEHVGQRVELDIFGPEEDANYVAECREVARALPPHAVVRFRGAIEPERVRSTLGDFDVMVFPTAGENFGHVIAEALSASCVVAAPDTTPWSGLLSSGGGVVVPSLSAEDWAAVLDDMVNWSPAERLERRRAAGAAYLRWRRTPLAPHVFEALLQAYG